MSAIADLATFNANLAKPIQRLGYSWNTLAAVVGKCSSLFGVGPLSGAAPTTAVVPASNIAGALGQTDGGSGQLWMPRMGIANNAIGTFMLCDRLSHQGGLSGTATGAQTTNLPTAALTRYTNGYGVMIGLEIYTTIGTTARTVTASYTDSESAGSATTTAVAMGGTNDREAGRMIILPLANQDSSSQGHNGVTAVASVTLSGSTSTIGNFGVTLFKPLLIMPIYGLEDPSIYDAIMSHGSNCPEIFDGACLFGMVFPGTSGTGVILPDLTFIET